jgi:Ca2+-binding EF-hand superfamily protein
MNIEQVVREVKIVGSVQGMDGVAKAYGDVTDGADRAAVVTDKATKAQISAANAIEKLRLNYQDGYRQQQKFTDAQAAYQRAEEQGLITKKAAAAELVNIQNKLGQTTNAQKAMGTVTSDLNNRVQASAGAFGVAGAALSALGPVGIGVAAVMGAVYLAINHMISEADRMGEGALAMRAFSETTGLSISQLKSLGKAGAEFGVGTDVIAASVDKFTINMEEARKSTGKLFDEVRMIDGGLATELAATKTTAQAWDVLAKARNAASDQSKNALSKAAFNKGGLETGLVLDVTAEAGGLEALVAKQQKLNGLTDDQIKKWGITKVQIEETQKRTANLMAATYTQEVLDRLLQAAQLEERVTRALIDSNAQRQKGRSYLDLFSAGVDTNPVTPREAANSNLAAGLSSGQKPDLSGYDAMAKKLWEVASAEKAVKDARKEAADAATGQSNLLKEQIGYLGSAATADEKRAQKLKELEAAYLTSKVSAETYNRAVAAVNLDTAIAKQSAYVSALGASAPIAELVKDKELQLQRQRQQDPRITQAIIDQQKALVASQQLGTFQIDAMTAAENVRIAALFKSNEAGIAYAIVQTKINEANALGKPLQDDEIEKLKRSADAFAAVKVKGDAYTELMNTARQSATSFTGDLISGLRDGKTGMEALSAAATNLSKTLTNSALTDLFKGNFLQAGVEGIAALVSGVLGNNTKGNQWYQQQLDGMNTRNAQYQQRIAAAGIDTNTRAGAIAAQDAQFTQERIAENKAGGQAMNALLQAELDERIALQKDWDAKDLASAQAALDAKAAVEKAAADRSLTFQNRLFAATNDFSSLEGQLAAFDRAAQQERITEAQNGNQAIVDLEAAQAAERFNVIKSYNDKIVADSEAAAKAVHDAQNSATKNILDYVNSLTAGSSSGLSPQGRFDASQSAYNAKLVLAQSGNVDAQGGITTDFENYRQAAQAMFGSTAAYQQIFSTGIQQLLNLPVVQATTDPVLVVMRDVLTAINAGILTQATDATLVGTIKAAIDAGNAAQVATALSTYFNAIDTNTSQSIDFNEMKSALGGMVNDAALRDMFTRLDTDNSGAIDRLELIKAASQATTTAAQSIDHATSVDIINAVNAGNATAVANALSNYFNAIDTNTSQSIDYNELVTALTPVVTNTNGTINQAATTAALATMANNVALRDMFTRLDTDASGSIDKMELIRAQSAATNTNTGNTTGYLVNGIAPLLDAIRALQSTANTQLQLLNAGINPAANGVIISFITAGAGTSNPTLGHAAFGDQMLTTLYKISVNTWAIAGNTRGLAGGAARDGTFASGGLVTGPGTGTSDSIRAMLSNREYVIPNARVEQFGVSFFDQLRAGILPRSIANDNFSIANDHFVPYPAWAPAHAAHGDNADARALLAAIARLETRLAAIEGNTDRTVRATVAGAEHVGERVDRVADAAQDAAREQKFVLAA